MIQPKNTETSLGNFKTFSSLIKDNILQLPCGLEFEINASAFFPQVLTEEMNKHS